MLRPLLPAFQRRLDQLGSYTEITAADSIILVQKNGASEAVEAKGWDEYTRKGQTIPYLICQHGVRGYGGNSTQARRYFQIQ